MKLKLLTVACAAFLAGFTANTFAAPGYVAHEWGTFTSVQGSDGELISWSPFVAGELPAFVYQRNRLLDPAGTNPAAVFGLNYKGGANSTWLQRMETPVIYFYTDTPMRVDATVEFPRGIVTEWYPLVESFGPRGQVTRSFAQWKGLEVRPATAAGERALPTDASGNHYYAARETDAALVSARSTVTDKVETDKFLFYRGVGNFRTPLTARFEAGTLTLRNDGKEAIGPAFVFEVRGERARLVAVSDLATRPKVEVTSLASGMFWPLAQVRAEIASAMSTALIQAGLYPREATAMVRTWEASWFSEEGLRVLYLLPRAWADGVLPLKLEPAPRELARVFVGRAEILPPELERNILTRLERGDVLEAVAAELKVGGLGRFTDPAIQRARSLHVARLAAAPASKARPAPGGPSPYE